MDRLLASSRTSSADHAALLRRLAEGHAELRAAALRDTQAESDPAKITLTRKVADAASHKAIAYYSQLLTQHPDYASTDEVLFYCALEDTHSNDLKNARGRLFDIIKKHPQSRFVPLSYFMFGELFRLEAEADKSKLDLASSAYRETSKYPASQNPVHCLARMRASEVEGQRGNRPYRAQFARDALRCVEQTPQGQLELESVRQQATATLTTFGIDPAGTTPAANNHGIGGTITQPAL
jgi:hypothetical protein